MSLVTGHFFLVLLLNQQWSPPLTLKASHCSIFRIMCDVPSTTVFCSESIECFPSTASKFFRKLLVTIPVAPIITGLIVRIFQVPYSLYLYIYYYYYYYYYYTIWMSLVTGISSWYFSWTSSDPHRSRFKLHTAVFSVLCVMFQV